jgi:hypothetical protein
MEIKFEFNTFALIPDYNTIYSKNLNSNNYGFNHLINIQTSMNEFLSSWIFFWPQFNA